MSSLDLINWHKRFVQQARWTAQVREYGFGRAGLASARRVLEVGCGSGALLGEVTTGGRLVCGLDIDPAFLRLAGEAAPKARRVQGDGHTLPFAAGSFDLTFCHFVLLWVADPAAVLAEMRRVTRSGGAVLALAEPDYGGRIDYPELLAVLGRWQAEALARQGAEPAMGRRLAGLLHAAGLREVETGVLGGQWSGRPAAADREAEWAVLESDLHGLAPASALADLRRVDAAAWERGDRVLFVPTFYGWGVV